MIFINTLKEGRAFQEIYLVKTVNASTYAKGKILTVTLQDKTGSIVGKKWNYDDDDLNALIVGNFVNVNCSVTKYNNKLELTINSVRKVDVTNIDDYIPTSPIPSSMLQTKFEKYLHEIKDPDIKTIVDDIYQTYHEQFLTYPAASSNHHAFKNGLLFHTVSMLEVADFLSKHYKDIDRDLLLAGVFLHDIGKVKELVGLLPMDYTVVGHLLGHLVIASNLINNAAVKHHLEDNEKIILLEHLVIASHGKYEFGSPILGATKEAIMLNYIDDLDAKMMMCENNLKDLEAGEFTGRLLNFDSRRLYKKKLK